MEWMIMPLKRYADFDGRSRRMEYWMFQIFQTIVIILMVLLIALIGSVTGAFETEEPSPIFMGVCGLFVLGYLGAFLIPNIAVTVRRFHDQDKSGWMYLLNFIPYVGGLIVFVMMFMDGTRGPNQFGDDPKGGNYLGDVFS